MQTTTLSCERYLVKAPMQFMRRAEIIDWFPEKDYLLRVDVCGLCRSDLYSAVSWARDWEELGHEFGGTIVSTRQPGGRFQVGQRVAVRNASACMQCSSCRLEGYRRCQRLVVNKQGFRQYAQCDERSLVAADGLDDDLLALAEPTNVALDLLNSAQIRDAERVTVLGGGTLGLITSYLLALKYTGLSFLLVGRNTEQPLTKVLNIPYYVSFDQACCDTVRRILGRSPDVILVTTPPLTLLRAMDLIAPGGRILTVGLDNDESCPVSLDVRALIFKRASLAGVFAVPNLFFEPAVSLLTCHGEPLRSIIRHRIRYAGLEQYFREWNQRGRFDGKAVLLVNEG